MCGGAVRSCVFQSAEDAAGCLDIATCLQDKNTLQHVDQSHDHMKPQQRLLSAYIILVQQSSQHATQHIL